MLKKARHLTRPAPAGISPAVSLPRQTLCPGTRHSAGKAAGLTKAEVEVKVEQRFWGLFIVLPNAIVAARSRTDKLFALLLKSPLL